MASGIKIPTAIQELIQNKRPNPKVQHPLSYIAMRQSVQEGVCK
jgi:hypothetical protein